MTETIAGLNDVVRVVVDGDTVAVILILSVRPKLLSVMVDVAELPATMLGGTGVLPLIVKSPVTVTVNTTE